MKKDPHGMGAQGEWVLKSQVSYLGLPLHLDNRLIAAAPPEGKRLQ